jgi:hypothetical protein
MIPKLFLLLLKSIPMTQYLCSSVKLYAQVFALLAVLSFPFTGRAQKSMLNDVQRLAQALDPSEWEKAAAFRATESAANTEQQMKLIGILAAYAYTSRDEALSKSYSADMILKAYRDNPYFKEILRDSTYLSLLRSDFDSVSVRNTIMEIRKGPREVILQELNSGDVYANNKMFRAPALIQDYQQPRIDNSIALEKASKSVSPLSVSDPASLTANILSGLADWIGRQAQEEFVQTFLLKLQEDLSDKELNVLFPNTYQYLDQLNLVNYKSIIQNARLAFARDLNTLSLNVSNYLFASGQLDKNDPLSFSLLLVFRLVDLIQRDLPLPNILAYANGEFSRRKFESEKILHDSLIAFPDDPAYQALQNTFQTANAALTTTYNDLGQLENRIKTKLSNVPGNFRDSFEIYHEVQDLLVDINSFSYTSLFKNKENKYLREVSSFLAGQLDYTLLRAYPSFEGYENTFLSNPPSATELRGVGLTMIRALLRREQGNFPLVRDLGDYLNLLLELDDKVNTLNTLVREKIAAQMEDADKILHDTLIARLEREVDFWEAEVTLPKHELEAFSYLTELAEFIFYEDDYAEGEEKYVGLKRVEKLLVEHVLALQNAYPQVGPTPLLPAEEVNNRNLSYYQNVDQTRQAMEALQKALTRLERTPRNEPLLRSYANASLFSSVLESGAQLMYTLAISQGDTTLNWVKPAQMADLLNDDLERQVFLGFLYQRIAGLVEGFQLDSRGLAAIATEVVQQFTVLDTLTNDQSSLISKVEFAGNVLNSILETPILKGDRGLQSVVQRFETRGISKVPDINRELIDLFKHTEKKDYRYALDNVLQLIDLFNVYPTPKKWRERIQNKINTNQTAFFELQNRIEAAPSPTSEQWNELALVGKKLDRLEDRLVRKDSLRYLKFRESIFKYGHFIAGVAAADSPGAVQAAMETIALPPKSSQNKRMNPFSIELNAYFGGTAGYERFLDEGADSLNTQNGLNSYGLFVPIGVAFSKRLGKKSNTSLSLFFPIIDLGALTAYRTDATAKNLESLPDLNFANVLSPGAHLMLNLPKSPFFIGAGVQYGPNVREIDIDGSFEPVRAIRYMLSFGVDVPVIPFFGN